MNNYQLEVSSIKISLQILSIALASPASLSENPEFEELYSPKLLIDFVHITLSFFISLKVTSTVTVIFLFVTVSLLLITKGSSFTPLITHLTEPSAIFSSAITKVLSRVITSLSLIVKLSMMFASENPLVFSKAGT